MDLDRETFEMIEQIGTEKVVSWDNVKVGMRVRDDEWNIGIIVNAKDMHNIEVYFKDRTKGLYCLDKKCSEYDELLFEDEKR